MKSRPYVVSIAGFDPSSGAGLTADIKTFEALKCYGLAVCTANTIQNDKEFEMCYWNDLEVIKSQISILFKRFKIEYVKIGIVPNWNMLDQITDFLLKQNDSLKIVLDPVLRSSSNFDFLSNPENLETLDQVLEKVYIVTPNYQEIERLYNDKTIEETIAYICNKTNLYLKGGHRKDRIGVDQLFTIDGKQYTLNPKMKNISEKHGSGCILSSAITAKLSLGFPLIKACYRGKMYTEKVLSSNKSLLGYHRI